MACCHGDLAAAGSVCSGRLYSNQGANHSGLQEMRAPITADSKKSPATSVHVKTESEMLPVRKLARCGPITVRRFSARAQERMQRQSSTLPGRRQSLSANQLQGTRCWMVMMVSRHKRQTSAQSFLCCIDLQQQQQLIMGLLHCNYYRSQQL